MVTNAIGPIFSLQGHISNTLPALKQCPDKDTDHTWPEGGALRSYAYATAQIVPGLVFSYIMLYWAYPFIDDHLSRYAPKLLRAENLFCVTNCSDTMKSKLFSLTGQCLRNAMQDEKETILRARNVKVECKFADDTKTEFCSQVTTAVLALDNLCSYVSLHAVLLRQYCFYTAYWVIGI